MYMMIYVDICIYLFHLISCTLNQRIWRIFGKIMEDYILQKFANTVFADLFSDSGTRNGSAFSIGK